MTHELSPFTFATWIFTLHVAGVRAADENVRSACQAVLDATDATAGNAAAERIVAAARALLPDAEPATLAAASRSLYGDRVRSELADADRDVRVAKIRKYQFTSQLPWMARIWERSGEGAVRPHWVLVERVTDEVTAADPNPWNDVDETRHYPLSDFHVLWELDGCSHVHLTP